MEEGASAAAGGRRRGRDCDDEQITRRDTHRERNERRERDRHRLSTCRQSQRQT